MTQERMAQLLEILVCPVCRQRLSAQPAVGECLGLLCLGCKRLYPIEDGIPVMLAERASHQS